MQFLVLCQYFVPLAVLTCAYARMEFCIWFAETPGNADIQRDSILQQRNRKVTEMMAGNVLLFGFCWFPYQFYNLLLPYYPEINAYPYINVIWCSFHWLAMSNSCCNPFLYAICNRTFRNEFKRRMTCLQRISFVCVCSGESSEGEMYELQNRHAS